MYTAYDVARQLIQIRNYVKLSVDGFAEIPADVLSAMLHQTAEYRDVNEMETLVKYGANPHETHEEFTVLEMFVQGHDGTWCLKNAVKRVEEGVKMLTKYGVTCDDLTHHWILNSCEEIIYNSDYLATFFNVEIPRVKVYYHVPRANRLKSMDRTFFTVDDAVKTLTSLTDHKQYIAVIENRGNVTRYLVSKGCGMLEVIPMEDDLGSTEKHEVINNIVNFVACCDNLPTILCED